MKNILLIVVVFFAFACRKDPTFGLQENKQPCPCITLEEQGIEVSKDSGAYWVYETFYIDSLGNEQNAGYSDTIWALGEHTFTDGIIYNFEAGYYNGLYTTNFWRDSCGFRVNQYSNDPYFDFNYSCGDTLLSMNWEGGKHYTLAVDSIQKTVPFGTFVTGIEEGHTYSPDSSAVNTCGDFKTINQAFYHSYYGLIAIRNFSSLQDYNACSNFTERRLVNYYEP